MFSNVYDYLVVSRPTTISTGAPEQRKRKEQRVRCLTEAEAFEEALRASSAGLDVYYQGLTEQVRTYVLNA